VDNVGREGSTREPALCSIDDDVRQAQITARREWNRTREQAADFSRLMLGEQIDGWRQFRWPWNSSWIWAMAPRRLAWPANMLLFNPNGANGPALVAVQVHQNEDGKQSLRIVRSWLWSDVF
jgi:hypothetical protein